MDFPLSRLSIISKGHITLSAFVWQVICAMNLRKGRFYGI